MRLPARLNGNHELVPWLNSLRDAIASLQIRPGIGYRVRESSEGTILESFSGGGKSEVRQYRIKSVQGDYYTCRTWNGTNEGTTDVYIAKPAKLRHSITSASIDGVSVSYTYAAVTGNLDGKRTATPSGGTAEAEIVIPRWLANDTIYAMDVDFTGVSVAGSEIKIIDLNCDGRAWAKKYS